MNTPNPVRTARTFPAETGGGVAGAIALLIVHAFGVTDISVYSALVIIVGATPTAITWLVNTIRRRNGGAAA